VHENRVRALRLWYPEEWFGVLRGKMKRVNQVHLGEELEDVEVGRGAALARKKSFTGRVR
jgi:alpha-mannosidase